ncbi:LysR family transcriptional regulator [uncultured Cohaesibacter sp.]|uniref:LysR family transcriptional regulator n=1 Tax=uncultured Cohaesibacter sp. TaxID=1002546 RepID=UPI0029C8418C|nr:LysR family transcriptional regulator [uncultured Cohaesibacter sp.]
MDTRQLETLLAIVQHGGFAAAAEAVNLTASAVSQQIAALESELETNLFDRSRRPPVLTVKGAEMVRSARAILQIVTETKASVSGAKIRGTLAFGALRTAANSYVPQTFARLRSDFPDLNFRLRVGLSEQLMSEVASGQLDAALVADQVTVPSGLNWTEVLSEPLILLVPAGAKELSFEELVQSIPYIRYRIHVPLARQIDTEMARLGVEPRRVFSVNTMPAIVGCVEAGLGFSVVPEVALHGMKTSDLGSQPFGSPPIYRKLGVVRRPTSSRAAVLDALTAALSSYRT